VRADKKTNKTQKCPPPKKKTKQNTKTNFYSQKTIKICQ